MIEVEINSKKYKANCPLRIIHDGKEYWIKRATKTSGLYMNDIEPKDVLSLNTPDIRKQDKVQ